MVDTVSFRYVLFGLDEDALIYKSRLKDLHEHADFHDGVHSLPVYDSVLRIDCSDRSEFAKYQTMF